MRKTILVLGAVMAVLMFAMVGAGVALADTVFSTSSPTTKEDCKNGGYAKYGFKNQGRCFKAVKLPPPTDTTAPEIQFVDIYNNPPVSGRDRVGFYSNEPVQFTCALQDLSTNDPVIYEPCSGPNATDGSFAFDPSQYDGKHVKFYVKAVDAAGNVTEETLTWQVDAEFPTVAITSGPEEGKTISTGSVSFGWTASDNLEVSEVQCYLQDERVELIYVDGSAGPEDYLCGGTSYTGESRNPAIFSNLADGQYTFVVIAVDKAGQVVWAERTFTVDTTP
jgi:hypothetical protein